MHECSCMHVNVFRYTLISTDHNFMKNLKVIFMIPGRGRRWTFLTAVQTSRYTF